MGKNIRARLEKELIKIKDSPGIYAFVVGPEDYNSVVEHSLEVFTNKFNSKGIFLSVAKNYDSLLEKSKKSKIKMDNLFMIDASGEKNLKKSENCFVCDTKSLVGISLALTEAAQTGKFKFMMVDSLAALLMYNEMGSTQRFIHFILNKIKAMKMRSVVIALNDSESQKLFNAVSQLCDKVISLQ